MNDTALFTDIFTSVTLAITNFLDLRGHLSRFTVQQFHVELFHFTFETSIVIYIYYLVEILDFLFHCQRQQFLYLVLNYITLTNLQGHN